MDEQEAIQILFEVQRRGLDSPTLEPPYLSGLFAQQRRFLSDPSKTKAALCGRRSGKTESGAALLLQGDIDAPGELSVYVALRRSQARAVMWETLQRIEKRYRLGLRFVEPDKQLHVITPNDHRIWLTGCDDFSEIEKFRGPRYKRFVIDEAGSYGPYLSDLVEDVVEPALMDLGGELVMMGTPGAIPSGYFHDITTGKNPDIAMWSTHHWTMLDNPYLNDPQGYIEQLLRKKRWKRDTPRFLREYMGQWVLDQDSLAFPFDYGLNSASPPRQHGVQWRFVIGVDLGWHDQMAFVVLGNIVGTTQVYILESEKHRHMLPSNALARLMQMREEWEPQHIVVDTGGLGKAIAEDWRAQGLPCRAAEKTQKGVAIANMRAALMAGEIKVIPSRNGPLLAEWVSLTLNDDRTNFEKLCIKDASDAALYAHRALKIRYEWELEEPEHGSEEYWALKEEEMIANLEGRARRAHRSWWKPGYRRS